MHGKVTKEGFAKELEYAKTRELFGFCNNTQWNYPWVPKTIEENPKLFKAFFPEGVMS